MFLWVFVVGNLMRILPEFHERRLLTEGLISCHAILASLLVLIVPRESEEIPLRATPAWGRSLVLATAGAILMLCTVPAAEYFSTQRVYGAAPSGQRGLHFRFGPNADWKRDPLLREQTHN